MFKHRKISGTARIHDTSTHSPKESH